MIWKDRPVTEALRYPLAPWVTGRHHGGAFLPWRVLQSYYRVLRLHSEFNSPPPPPDVTAATGNFAWKPADRAMTLAVLAQSLATLRCCSMARDVIILADIFEEEDFYPSTFGFRLSPPVEDESLTDLLDMAEEAVQEQVP